MILNSTNADRLNELFKEKEQLEERFEETFLIWEGLV